MKSSFFPRPRSNITVATTLGLPAEISGVTVEVLSYDTVQLSWSLPTLNDCIFSQYHLQRAVAGTNAWQDVICQALGRTAAASGDAGTVSSVLDEFVHEAFFLDFLGEFVLPWGPFGFSFNLRSSRHHHRALLLQLRHPSLPPQDSGSGTGSGVTWPLMSNGLILRIKELSREADQLQVKAVELAESVAELLKPGQFGDWVLVDDSFYPLEEPDFRALKVLQAHHGLEDGFPEIPPEVVRIAARGILGVPSEVLKKATKAYHAGFLAHIALATETPYIKDPEERESAHRHWVVFYRITPAVNRRVSSRKCLDIAITVEDNTVWQGFESITELTIFCAGAGVGVPQSGGLLIAVPDKVLSAEAILDANLNDESAMLGPSREFTAQFMMEEDIGSGIVDLDATANILIVDIEDAMLEAMREYDPVTDFREVIFPFLEAEPNALPKLPQLLPVVREWIEAVAHDKLHFYSAREEQSDTPVLMPAAKKAGVKKAARTTLATLATQMATMQQQLQSVIAHQDVLAKGAGALDLSASNAAAQANGPMVAKIPALSASMGPGIHPKVAMAALGPPPKTRGANEPVPDAAPGTAPIQGTYVGGGDHQVINAISQQSLALTQLVAHLAGGDPMSDLASSSASTGLSLNTKGVARRERMQNDLAQRTSNYFLQVQQQLFKRMNPSRAVPKNAAELSQVNASMTSYLERYGGFKQCRETGLTMWILAHAMDAAAQDDFHATKEYMALLTAALEQSALDNGWGVAYVLSLMEEPPQQLFAERMSPVSATGRPFAPLVPPSWAAVALSYLKELEVLATRKTEMRSSTATPSKAAPPAGDGNPQTPSGGGRQCEPKVFSYRNSDWRELLRSGDMQMSYPKWCAMLVPMVLKSRTPFSAFLHRSIRLLRSSSFVRPSTPAFFPIPVVNYGQFDGMPSCSSSSRRRRCHLQRAIHVVCMALNFWFSGGRWLSEDEMRREPNLEHLTLFRRIASLIRSDGRSSSFSIAKSGRKHPELVAKLGELSGLLTAFGLSGEGYSKSFAGMTSVTADHETVQKLVPYSDLQSSRIQLFGTGHWDVTSLLADDLVMAYREPRSLLANLPLGPHPVCRDSEEEVSRLAHLWDKAGLLRLHRDHRPVGSLVKIFNCYKNEEVDRQIGDRRGQNSLECRVHGPSHDLPAGPDLMDLQVKVGQQKVVVIITDRKDYYHQLWCTRSRSSSNAVGPSVHRDLLSDTQAFSAFMLQSSMQKRRARLVLGDDLHRFSLHPGEGPEGEFLPPDLFWVCFGSVLQGDHAGVEIATSAHENWLKAYGLLDEQSRLVASRSLRSDSLAQGLVIDDYFAASVEDVGTANEDSAAAACYSASQEAYNAAQLLGSPAKDERGGNEGKLIGAFVNSSTAALSRGLCTVGAPAEKRIGLSFYVRWLLQQMPFICAFWVAGCQC
eukprot:s567_g8.t1